MDFTVNKPKSRSLVASSRRIRSYNFKKLRLENLSRLLQPKSYNEVIDVLLRYTSVARKVDKFSFVKRLNELGYSIALCNSIIKAINKDSFVSFY